MKNFFRRFGRGDKHAYDFNDKNDVLNYILNGGLAEKLEIKAMRQGNGIQTIKPEMYIKPIIRELGNNFVNLDFYVGTVIWNKHMYENCTGTGADTRAAVGSALMSFSSAFMSGIKRMTDKYKPRTVSVEFAGKSHDWNIYLSDVVAVGQKNEKDVSNKVAAYWNMLKDDIIKRLGNQQLVYVKIFAAKLPDRIIGECRFDDVPIPELGKKVAMLAAEWELPDPSQWASEKQFFFIEQSPETIIYNPYSDMNGQRYLKSLIVKYLKLLNSVETQEDYNSLVDRAEELLGDRVLAIECFNFLPEIAAEQGLYDEIQINDHAELRTPDGMVMQLYKSQLTDYYAMTNAFLEIVSEQALGDETKHICEELVKCSSVFGIIKQVREQGRELKNVSVSKLIFNVDEGFELR